MQDSFNTNSEQQDEQLSKVEAISGVISDPSGTYENISKFSKTNYWILPMVLIIIANIIGTFLFLQDEELTSKVMDKQKKQLREQMEEKVKSGDMTREDANTAIESAEKFMNPKSAFFQIIGYATAVVGPFLLLLILSLIALLILKILKGNSPFQGILNAIGLGNVIIAIGVIIGTVLSVVLGKLSGLSPALLFNEETIGTKLFALLTKLDFFYIWFYIVISIGIAKAGKVKTIPVIIILLSVFLIYSILTAIVF